MSTAVSDSGSSRGFGWEKHVGLLAAGATTTLICLKILAVAGWDSITAFGILASGGTVNVLTGTLLAVLPMLYGAVAVFLLPRVERKLRRRTPVERSAARMLETLPTVLLVFIVPVAMLIALFVVVLFIIFMLILQRMRAGRNAARKRHADGSEVPTRFETLSASLGCLVVLLFGSLHTPWVPPEVSEGPDGEKVVYVLNRDANEATVLVGEGRALARINIDALKGVYCTNYGGWWNETLLQVFNEDRYPVCPD
ncbi:hypothetical protein [Microbacterium faecale]|uniref:hypothetical protein n=1 Tax=Microbacterium faecale TaxID=1804630 RepID=UPI00166C900F|nr:hypothetical protein [Microbacterium faecale]